MSLTMYSFESYLLGANKNKTKFMHIMQISWYLIPTYTVTDVSITWLDEAAAVYTATKGVISFLTCDVTEPTMLSKQIS
jgi:hypothetical protein